MPLALSLIYIHMAAPSFDKAMQTEFDECLTREPRPPLDLWDRVALRACSALAWHERFEEVWNEPGDPADTHPSLRERVQALGLNRDEVAHSLEIALEAMRPPGNTGLSDQTLETHWQHSAAGWALSHARHAAGATRDTVAGWYDSPTASLYRKVENELSNRDRSSWPLLEAVIAKDPAWAFPIRQLATSAPRGVFSTAEEKRHLALLDKALQRRAAVASEGMKLLEKATAVAEMADDTVRDAVKACIATMPAIIDARLSCLSIVWGEKSTRYRLVVLGLRIVPELLGDARLSEKQLRAIFYEQLEALLAMDTLSLVGTSFTTETVPAWYSNLHSLSAAQKV